MPRLPERRRSVEWTVQTWELGWDDHPDADEPVRISIWKFDALWLKTDEYIADARGIDDNQPHMYERAGEWLGSGEPTWTPVVGLDHWGVRRSPTVVTAIFGCASTARGRCRWQSRGARPTRFGLCAARGTGPHDTCRRVCACHCRRSSPVSGSRRPASWPWLAFERAIGSPIDFVSQGAT